MFSVIIPVYNSAWCIKKCIDSVLNQTYKSFEIIVIDNYSNDGTFDIIQDYQDNRIRVFKIHNNGIIAASRNKGIKEAQGEWICFLDSDDWWTRNKLEECSRLTEDYDLIYHNLRGVTAKGERCFKLGFPPKKDVYVQILSTGNIISNSSACVRKSVLWEIGLLSEELTIVGVEDCDCWVRIAAAKKRFGFIPKILGYYWMGDTFSVSAKQINRLTVFFDKYIDTLPENKRRLAFQSLEYSKGRINHKLKDFKKAKYYYRRSFNFSSLFVVVRVLFLYMAAIVHFKI